MFKSMVKPGVCGGLLALLFCGSAVQAASTCKGLSSTQCSGKSDCVWVDGYKRKDGRKVTGYCRAKGGKGATTGKTKSEKASKKLSSGVKETSTSKGKEVTKKAPAKQSSGKKSGKEKTTTKTKRAGQSKGSSNKAKTKKKTKTKTSD